MYEKFYNLDLKPFRLNSDPRFFFNSKTHKRALSYLFYGVEQREGITIITGEVGTGKTSLVGKLLVSLDDKNTYVVKIATSKLEPIELLRLICAELELEYHRLSKAVLLKNLESHLIKLLKNNIRVLLIVDESQNLNKATIEEIRILSNMLIDGEPLVQCFLLGQKEFRTLLEKEGFEQLRQRVIANYHLEPLECQETKEYILHRLKVAGWDGDPVLDENVMEKVHQCTGGTPRKINLLLDRILLFGCLEGVHHIDSKTLEAVLLDTKDEFWGLDLTSNNEIEKTVTRNREKIKTELTKSDEKDQNISELQERISGLEDSVQVLGRRVLNELEQLRNKSEESS